MSKVNTFSPSLSPSLSLETQLQHTIDSKFRTYKRIWVSTTRRLCMHNESQLDRRYTNVYLGSLSYFNYAYAKITCFLRHFPLGLFLYLTHLCLTPWLSFQHSINENTKTLSCYQRLYHVRGDEDVVMMMRMTMMNLANFSTDCFLIISLSFPVFKPEHPTRIGSFGVLGLETYAEVMLI